jgi:hypothetical protein
MLEASESSELPNHFATIIFLPELVGSNPKPKNTLPRIIVAKEFVNAPTVIKS